MSESLEPISSVENVGIAATIRPAGKSWGTPEVLFIPRVKAFEECTKLATPLTAAERRALVEKPFPRIGSVRVVGTRYHHAGTELGQVVPYGADDIDAVIISLDRKRHRGRKPSMSDYEDR